MGLGTWEPPTQQAGVESESPRPSSGGKFGPLSSDSGPGPSRAKRARKRKAAKPNRLDLSCLAPKVASRKFPLSLCLIIPSPLHSHHYCWYSSRLIVEARAFATASSSILVSSTSFSKACRMNSFNPCCAAS